MSSLTNPDRPSGLGASATAIRAHYDVGDDFYRLWLDSSMTYSCGLWNGCSSLEEAQQNKLEFHIEKARASGCSRVLDVGCGWGSLIERLIVSHGVRHVVGLTLSPSQAKHIKSRIPGAEVRLESWRDHKPSGLYDAVISIGAMEHFVRPEDSRETRIKVYREFFESCRDWLRPEGFMSLQTIAYGRGDFVRGAISEIFPESDLPRLPEITQALEGVFELVELRNDREDYARTCRAWVERLAACYDHAQKIAGAGIARHFRAYLSAAARGFDLGVFVLYRFALRRL